MWFASTPSTFSSAQLTPDELVDLSLPAVLRKARGSLPGVRATLVAMATSYLKNKGY